MVTIVINLNVAAAFTPRQPLSREGSPGLTTPTKTARSLPFVWPWGLMTDRLWHGGVDTEAD